MSKYLFAKLLSDGFGKWGQMANLSLLLAGTYKASFLPTELQYGLTHTIIDLKTSFILIVLWNIVSSCLISN